MKKSILILAAILSSTVSMFSQTNLIKNYNADLGEKNWQIVGDAKIEKDQNDNSVFTIRNRGSFLQEINIPKDSAGKFVLLIGRGSSERVNPDGSITGLPYLYGYLFDEKNKKGGKINTYLTGQNLRGRISNSSEWVIMYGIFEIPPGTVSAQIFLNQAEKKNLPQNGSAARFDDVGFYLFEGEKEASEFIKNYD